MVDESEYFTLGFKDTVEKESLDKDKIDYPSYSANE